MKISNQFDALFFGAVKVGERGQVVIPADARREYDLKPGTRLLVFGHPFGHGLSLIKVESVHELFTELSERLKEVQHETTEDDGDDADARER